jgi:hypothetical protein
VLLERILLGENSKSRDHIHSVFLNAEHYLAIAKMMGDLGIGKSAAIQLALNRGLHDLGVLSLENYDLLDARYRRPLLEIIAENKTKRENSHLSKIEIEKQKKELVQAAFHPVKSQDPIEANKATLKGMYEQWEDHPDIVWRIRTVNYAKKYPEDEYAKKLIGKDCDNISQGKGEKESAI